MDSTHPLIITGKTGAGKSQLLKHAISQGLKIAMVDGLTHKGALKFPNPVHVSCLAIDHVCSLKNGSAVVAQAYAWCRNTGSELILVDQILSKVQELLPPRTPEALNVHLTKQGGERIVEITAHGKIKTVLYTEWVQAMSSVLNEPAAAGPGK